MVCFCHKTSSQLLLALQLDAELDLSLDVDIALALELKAVAAFLAKFGLPAAPWTPDPSWLELQLPSLSLSASAMATLSAFAQLRAQFLAQFGIDIAIPGQGVALARLTATLNARLSAMLSMDADLSLSLAARANVLMKLAATLSAALKVEEALALGLLPSPPPGPPLSQWRPFVIQLRALLPLIALSVQLGIDLTADISAQLSAMLRVMLRIQLPGLGTGSLLLMANLTATLSAVAQLRLALGIDPLTISLPALTEMVNERVGNTAQAVQSQLGLSLSLLLELLLKLPTLQFNASLMVTPAVVKAAMSLNARALASLNWGVPEVASLPVLSIGLPVVALTAQLQAALNLSASLAPCATGCDAASLLRGSLPTPSLSAAASGMAGVGAGLSV